MLIRGATEEQVAEAAAKVGVRVNFGNAVGRGFRFTLRTSGPTSDGQPVKYGRRSTHMGSRYKNGSLRRIPGAVCWHGHRDFMRALYTLAPDAVLATALATYRGQEHFEQTYRGTGASEGSTMYQFRPYQQACDCGPEIEFQRGELVSKQLQTAHVRTLKQSSMLACPHCIMVPSHYREDESCRCNDPTHTEMKEWGYTWKKGQWR